MRIAYLQKPEEMLVYHKQALALMMELSANPNPVNYHLMYEYAVGENPAFNAVIDRMLVEKQAWSDILGVRLTEAFFKEQERTIVACEQELMDVIGEMTDNVNKHVDTHFQLAQALETNPKNAVLISAHLKKANRLLSHEVNDSQQRVQAARARLVQQKQVTMTDMVTRLHNELHLREFLPVIVKRNQPSGKRILLALMDVDHFAAYNARHGHHRGDSLLRAYAKVLLSLGEGTHAWRVSDDAFLLAMVLNHEVDLSHLIRGVYKKLTSVHFKDADGGVVVSPQPITMVVDLVTASAQETLNALHLLLDQHRNQSALIFSDVLQVATT